MSGWTTIRDVEAAVIDCLGWVRGGVGGGYVYCAFACPADRFRVDSE